MSTKQQVLYWGSLVLMLLVGVSVGFALFHLHLFLFSVFYRLAVYFHYLP